MKKMKKNNLDERQEQKLLQIEHNGCWMAFWMLVVSLFVQQMVFGIGEWKYVAGEWIVFMCLALYLSIGCIKNGIWDRRLLPDKKTNLIVSIVAAVVFGVVFAAINYVSFHSAQTAGWTWVIVTIFLFVAIFAALSFCTALFKKRVSAMEKNYEKDEDEN